MKRHIAWILVFSIMFSLSGCSINTDALVDELKSEVAELFNSAVDEAKNQASEAIDNAIEDAKAEVSDKIEDAKEEAGQQVGEIIDGITSDANQGTLEFPKTGEDTPDIPQTGEAENTWWQNVLGYDMTVTFVPNGGMGGPTCQRFKGGSHVKITEEKPTRDGHHFVGWALEGSNEPQFFAGMKTWCAFSRDATLYACWEEYNPNDPFTVHKSTGKSLNFGGFFESFGGSAGTYIFPIKHDYHLTTQNRGKIIRIQCDCGLELIDRDISKDNFVNIKSNGENKTFDSLGESKKEEYNKEWILYRTQDFAPVVIALIASFYESFGAASQDFDFDKNEFISYYNSYDYDVAISGLSGLFDTLNKVSDFEAKVAKWEYAPEAETLKFTYYDHNYKGQTIAQVLSEMRTEDISKPYREFANEYFTIISKGSKYASTAISICRAFYYAYNAFDSENNEILTERTLSMVKAIHAIVVYCPTVGKYYDKLFSTLEEGLELYEKCYKYQQNFYALLSEILVGTQDIEEINLSLLDVDQARIGNFDDAPSVMEVLGYLSKTTEGAEKNNYSRLSKNHKTLVIWYLTMRLEYDFQREYGIKLKDYQEYIK